MTSLRHRTRRRVRAHRHHLAYRFASDESGVALLEFSLVVMMLAVLAFGTINWARFFLLRAQLGEAIRDAARYGATVATETSADSLNIARYARTLFANATRDSLSGTVDVTFVGTTGVDRRVRVALSTFPFVRVAPFAMGVGRTIAVAAEFRRER